MQYITFEIINLQLDIYFLYFLYIDSIYACVSAAKPIHKIINNY